MRLKILGIYLITLGFLNTINANSKEYPMEIKAHIKTGRTSSLSIDLSPDHVDLEFLDIEVENLDSSQELIRKSEKIEIRNPGNNKRALPPNTVLEFKIRGDSKKRGYLMPENQSYNQEDSSKIKNKLVAEIRNVKNYNTSQEGREEIIYDTPQEEISEVKKVKTIENKLVEITLVSYLDTSDILKEYEKGYDSYTNISQLEVKLIVN